MGTLIYADAIHIVEQSKIDAARITQKSGNEKRGASTALQQFSSSLSNLRNMDAAGAAINDSSANTARLQMAATTNKLSDRVKAAEALGGMAAMAGAAGVGGASVETYNETVRLRNAIQEEHATRQVDTQTWASGQQRANAIKTAVATQDNSVYRADQDYQQYVDHKKPSTLEKVMGIAGTIAATVVAGPQAGAAVMGVFEARQATRNADFATASSAVTGAIKNGAQAAYNFQRTHGGGDTAPSAPSGGNGMGEISTGLANTGSSSSFSFDTPSWGSVNIK